MATVQVGLGASTEAGATAIPARREGVRRPLLTRATSRGQPNRALVLTDRRPGRAAKRVEVRKVASLDRDGTIGYPPETQVAPRPVVDVAVLGVLLVAGPTR